MEEIINTLYNSRRFFKIYLLKYSFCFFLDDLYVKGLPKMYLIFCSVFKKEILPSFLLCPLIEKIKGVGYDKELKGPKPRSRESNFFLFLKEKCQTKKLN